MKRMEIKRMLSRYEAIKQRHEKRPDAKLAGILRDIEHRYHHETGEPIGSREG